MKKRGRIWSVVIAVVVIVVFVVFVNMFADRAVKAGIESAATNKLNVPVAIGDLDLSLLGGRITFGGLSVGNPPGYEHDRLLELGRAYIDADVTSLLSDVVNISTVDLSGVKLVIEQKSLTGNNLQEVLKTVSSSGAEAEEGTGARKLHIDRLDISDITVRVKLLPVPGKADTLTIKVAPISMTDLGGDDKLDTAALTGRVLAAIAAGVAGQGRDVLPTEILGPMQSQLKDLEALPSEILKEGADAVKQAEDVGKDITAGIKGLFRKKE
jgi:hypothetical protein